MQVSNTTAVLDRDQLRDITLDDEDLMREILSALIDDTSRQIRLLEAAIREEDVDRCVRLAHYSKGACSNVGAHAAAATLKRLEHEASSGDFSECSESLVSLGRELDRLRAEAVAV